MASGNAIVKWEKPSLSFVKCNIDASWVNTTENTGASWLLRNSSGEPLLHSRRSFSAISTKLEAELLSFSWAIDCLSDLRFDCGTSHMHNSKAIDAPTK
ncbi:hypothetical protein F2Q70_00004510 [Brassica cretica]|uniref:RNase H type-1 domain-containing protein n=1 Tax=Brassica cretica TaxID=69181 RepID=A0A8S9IW56_BRACR|nr:hypothetical protein F2Q70_00004510 [Brassica cretica]